MLIYEDPVLLLILYMVTTMQLNNIRYINLLTRKKLSSAIPKNYPNIQCHLRRNHEIKTQHMRDIEMTQIFCAPLVQRLDHPAPVGQSHHIPCNPLTGPYQLIMLGSFSFFSCSMADKVFHIYIYI